MPFGSEGLEDIIALAMSGGGFRAPLFHVGSLWRLNELGILGKLGRISSISGDTIAAGVLAEAWRKLAFNNGTATNFRALIVAPLRAFCRRDVDAPAIGEGVLLPWKRASDKIEATYGSYLVNASYLAGAAHQLGLCSVRWRRAPVCAGADCHSILAAMAVQRQRTQSLMWKATR